MNTQWEVVVENVNVAERIQDDKLEIDQEASLFICIEMRPWISAQRALEQEENFEKTWRCKFRKGWLQA